MPTLIVHGGCGAVAADEQELRRVACERAAEAGWAILKKGGSALDAEGRTSVVWDTPFMAYAERKAG